MSFTCRGHVESVPLLVSLRSVYSVLKGGTLYCAPTKVCSTFPHSSGVRDKEARHQYVRMPAAVIIIQDIDAAISRTSTLAP